VEVRLPVSTTIDEKYFYLEVVPSTSSLERLRALTCKHRCVCCVEKGGKNAEGKASAEASYRECTQKQDGDLHTRVKCEISSVTEAVTMYIHAVFPKDKFTAADLANLERSGAKVIGTLSVDGVMVNEVGTPLLAHWRDEL